MIIALPLHILAALVWVGGMLAVRLILRPSVGALDQPVQLTRWRSVVARLIPCGWVSILVLLATGYGVTLAYFGGFQHLPPYVNVMQGLGIMMALAFAYLFFVPWKRFRGAIDASDWPGAAAQLGRIRGIVTFNLVLGLLVVAVAGGAPYWG